MVKLLVLLLFLYQIHGAPKDFTRFTKQHLEKILKESNFKNIHVEELGTGPFLACISLLRGYFKFIPVYLPNSYNYSSFF